MTSFSRRSQTHVPNNNKNVNRVHTQTRTGTVRHTPAYTGTHIYESYNVIYVRLDEVA